MTGFWDSLSGAIVAGVIALPVGYYVRMGVDNMRDRLNARDIIDLFGLKTGPARIVHSSIFDEQRRAYNYPSCDFRATRAIANLFDRAHRQEDRDFHVQPEFEILIAQQVDPMLWRQNLVLLCGPKRNSAVAEAFTRLPSGINYTMTVDPATDRNLLRDNRRNHLLKSSREDPDVAAKPVGGYDYGLVLSMQDAFYPGATVTILAGVHGTGTLGCGEFLSDPKNVRELLRRRKNGVIAEAIRVDYGSDFESITEITLV